MRRSGKKKVAVTVILILVICSLSGCGTFFSKEPEGIGIGSVSGAEKKEQTQLAAENSAKGEKYQITLGCIETLVPQLLSAAIVDFNKSNPHYEVVIKGYDWQEGQQRLEMELSTGRGPDIFDLSMVYVDALVEKGMIMDLSAYLSDGKGLERADLVESVLECNTKEGVLTCIPPRFNLDIMVGKKSVIGERSAWSVEEFLQCVSENEGVQVLRGLNRVPRNDIHNKDSIVHIALYQNLEHFVKRQTGEVNFSQEDFKQLLRQAKDFEVAPFDYNENSGWYQSLVEQEKLLLAHSSISSVRDYTASVAILGEDVQFIGFPTYDGSSCMGIRNVASYGINADSRVKDGAWAFLEYLITYRVAGSQIDEHGFYTANDMLEEQFADGMEKEYIQGLDGEKLEKEKYIVSGGTKVYAATQEDIQQLREWIEKPTYVYGLDSNSVYRIVEEEVYSYLEGTTDLEGTIELIENRVNLYLEEQK